MLMENRIEPEIIGGMFGLEEVLPNLNGCTPPFLKGRDIFLANGRSGIWLLIELLSPSQVWMPSYLCGGMLPAVDQSATDVRFYEVDYDLAVPSLEWLDNVRPGDLVILIDYFGFPCDSSCAARAKEQGAWVLEDACQALLSGEVGQFSDFVVFSPRKFLGVPDGGVLILNRELDCQDIDLTPPPAEWWLKAFSASVLRREFDIHGGNRHWFKLFQEADSTGPIGYYAMSELSKALLRHSFDYSTIAQRRIDNYKFLTEVLGDIALFPSLSANIVPLGFPIRVKNRDRLRQMLLDHQIYPPVHWPIQGIVPRKFRDSHKLADEIMTLPCDQRYDRRDMKRMVSVILGS
jgi:dTDP-4-amino-4,6-dideoxygalactose transaminase